MFVDYAKAGEEDILCRITAYNRGPEPAALHILPHAWYRNTWSWGYRPGGPCSGPRPTDRPHDHRHLGERWWYLDDRPARPDAALHRERDEPRSALRRPERRPLRQGCVPRGDRRRPRERVNPGRPVRRRRPIIAAVVEPGGSMAVRTRLRLRAWTIRSASSTRSSTRRMAEADEFYRAIQPPGLDDDQRRVQRQAYAGLLWSKQFYHYSVELWLDGDPAGPEPPSRRRHGRNAAWGHLYNLDVLSVPDKWEYPWFAAWDTAFHCVALARIDPEWAKRQVVLLLREWYMHPSGQLPAYEWDFSDANPPVHAHAALRVYEIDARAVRRRPTPSSSRRSSTSCC